MTAYDRLRRHVYSRRDMTTAIRLIDQLERADTERDREVERLREHNDTLRGEVMARDSVIRDRDTENDRLRRTVEHCHEEIDELATELAEERTPKERAA